MRKVISILKNLPLLKLLPFWGEPTAGLDNQDGPICCSGQVHIAYRGVSDERLYISKGRSWGEVRYFRPNGLRVFCADCRRRLI